MFGNERLGKWARIQLIASRGPGGEKNRSPSLVAQGRRTLGAVGVERKEEQMGGRQQRRGRRGAPERRHASPAVHGLINRKQQMTVI